MKYYHYLSGVVLGISILAVPVQAQPLTDNFDTTTNNCINLKSNLAYRSIDALTGGEVSALQDFLSPTYFSIEPTGFFGRMTELAVMRFQAANGIPSVGRVGPLTRMKIKTMTCEVLADPNAQAQTNTNTGTQTQSGTQTQTQTGTTATNGTGNGDTYTITIPATATTKATTVTIPLHLPPIVNNFWPNSLAAGDPMTLYGSSFRSTAFISFDNDNATIDAATKTAYPTSVTSSALTFVLPQGLSLGAHTLRVRETGSTAMSGPVSFTISATGLAAALSFQGPYLTLFTSVPVAATKSIMLMWQASAATGATITMSCAPGSVQFTTNKGTSLSCSSSKVWTWAESEGQSTSGIILYPKGNAQPVNVDFTLTLEKCVNGTCTPTGQTKTITVSVPVY